MAITSASMLAPVGRCRMAWVLAGSTGWVDPNGCHDAAPGREVLDVLVLLHAGQGQDRDDEQAVAEPPLQVIGDRHGGIPDLGRQPRLGGPAPVGDEGELPFMDEIAPPPTWTEYAATPSAQTRKST